MRCRLEKNNLLFKILCVVEKSYASGDFEELFHYLAEDCIFESQWVLEPNVGYDATVKYLRGKGETLKRTQDFPHGDIVELVGNMNPIKKAKVSVNGEVPTNASVGLFYEPGKLCLLLEQELETEIVSLLIDVQLNDEDKIARIDLCMPELFKYRDFYTYINLCPAKGDDENEEAMVRVSESYYSELYFFLDQVGIQFDEYDDLTFPIEQWLKALELWRQYAKADNFDQVLEEIAGIDYVNNTVQHPELAKRLCDRRKTMWVERKNNKSMVDGLIEWTQKYRDTNDCIKSYGW